MRDIFVSKGLRILLQCLLLSVLTFQHSIGVNVSVAEQPTGNESGLLQFPLVRRNTTNIYNVMKRRLAGVHDDDVPLFEGEGVHYVFIWVGTPPQRVSVIVDTGSHYTAFPCVGCKCGKHVSKRCEDLIRVI